MRRGTWAENQEALSELSTDGVIAVAALESLGVARSTAFRRCQEFGPWRRLLPGVVMLHNGPPTTRQRTIAALIYCGQGAMLTGRSALREYGFDQPFVDVHVLLPDRRRVQSRDFVHVERTTRLPEPEIRNGLACAPIERAVLDSARRMGSLDRARAIIATVVQRGATTAAALERELAEGSKRGSALPRAVLAEVDADVHSVPEIEARELWLQSGLPEMVFNVDIFDEAGRFIARPDGWIDSVAFAWQIDSLAWHLSPKLYSETVEKRTLMQSHGIIVLATTPQSVRKTPQRVIRDLATHYELAQQRPRPNVAARMARMRHP